MLYKCTWPGCHEVWGEPEPGVRGYSHGLCLPHERQALASAFHKQQIRIKENQAQQIIGDRPSACSPPVSHWGIKDLAQKKVNLGGEILYTWVGVAVTLIVTFLLYKDIFVVLSKNLHSRNWGSFAQDSVFAVVFLMLIYGNLVYQLARAGYLRRLRHHLGCAPEDTEAWFLQETTAPPVTILIPSYKEEPRVIRQALYSSALQNYPARRVVLLIDDPPQPINSDDLVNLLAVRNLLADLQTLFDGEVAKYRKAHEQFLLRAGEEPFDDHQEFLALSKLYGQAADWFCNQARQHKIEDHTDELFISLTFTQREQALRSRARALFNGASEWEKVSNRYELFMGYHQLASLFAVEFTSFERKQYVNLSWASNKAMNLNSYIGLIGRRYNLVVREDGTYLETTTSEAADTVVPDARYIVTLDADSLLAPDYVKRLIQFMERPGNERVAVAQTPYTAVPSPKGLLERIAGATTDLQYIVHQGFTQAGATYWVGANAILRKEALDDIVTHSRERGFSIAKYIQDRTVIEDTESSIDLVARGWSLYNLPERLSYSATPADFGSLLIQRRRWATGGLIILPKLLRHLVRTPHRLRTWIEGFMRVNYLTSVAGTNLGLLLILTLPANDYLNILWLPLTALPYYLIYGRDLVLAGYRVQDLFRVYALNFLLIPVNLGGVCKSIQQGVTGKQIPFSRTPKVRGRITVPPGYLLAGYALMLYCLTLGSLDLLDHRWIHALLAIGSAFVLLYATAAFIGFRASWEDLSYPFRSCLAQERESISPQHPALGLVTQPPAIGRGNRKRSARIFTLMVVAMVLTVVAMVLMHQSAVSAASMAKAVPVLTYHRIITEQTKWCEDVISTERFAEQMQFLADHGYHTLKVSELIDFIKGRDVPEGSVVLTFDDGWKSALNAVPVLNRHGFKGSFLIITACADGVFSDHPEAFQDDYMTWPEISQLAKNANFEFGSHTVTHPWAADDNLVSWIKGKNPGKGMSQIILELKTSKVTLESRLTRPIKYLAWPCGLYNQELINLATKVGYEALLTVDDDRANFQGDDVRFIKRLMVNGTWDLKTFQEALQKLQLPVGKGSARRQQGTAETIP